MSLHSPTQITNSQRGIQTRLRLRPDEGGPFDRNLTGTGSQLELILICHGGSVGDSSWSALYARRMSERVLAADQQSSALVDQ